MHFLTALGSRSLQRLAAYSTSAAATKVDKQSLMKLRKATGYSFVNCKRALIEHGEDLAAAEDWLHQLAQQEGWQKAVGLADKSARQGLIGVLADGHYGALLELNCQTDFVASSERFRALAGRLVTQTLALAQQATQQDADLGQALTASISIDPEHVLAQADLNEALAFETGKLGEKLAVSRAAALIVKPTDPQLHVYSYAHPKGIQSDGVQLGQFGTLVALRSLQPETTVDIGRVGQQLCLHVLGMKPKRIGTPPTAESVNEQQRPDPNEVVGEAEEGDDEQTVIRADEAELLKQQFIVQPDVSVHEYLTAQGVECLHFMRAERGDALE